MPDAYKLYLDQMLRLEVAQALKDEGHDVLRASEVGQARADDYQILQKAIDQNGFIPPNYQIAGIGSKRAKNTMVLQFLAQPAY